MDVLLCLTSLNMDVTLNTLHTNVNVFLTYTKSFVVGSARLLT